MTKESKNIAKIVNTPIGSLIHVGEKKIGYKNFLANLKFFSL